MNTTRRKGTIDIVFIVILFVVSIGIHYYYVTYLIQDITDKMQLFSAASVHSEKALEYIPHGAAYLYSFVLKFLFYVIGNKILVPVILQIVMKILGFLFLFFALRMSIGKICAFITTTILLFLPMNYELLNQITPVVMSVFFICIQYLFFALLLKGISRERFSNYGYGIVFMLYGILCSITIYTDILGIFFLVISLIGFLLLKSAEQKQGLQNKILQIICTLSGTVIGIIGICCIISSSLGMSFEVPYVRYFSDYILKISITDYLYFGFVIASILAGLIIQIICNQFLHAEEWDEEIRNEELEEDMIMTVKNVNFQQEPLKSVPLDNPLPVPKRHERREMDYAIELKEYDLDFDITEEKENDDFDIE